MKRRRIWHNVAGVLAVCAIAVFPFTVSCIAPVDGISPFQASPEIPRKVLVTTSGLAFHQQHFVNTVLHVDVERYNPLNALDYTIGWLSGGNFTPHSPLFETVVLGYAYLARNPDGFVVLRATPALMRLLNNTGTYIRPLTMAGIRVLVEVRSGRYGDDEAGSGLGLGAMEMRLVHEFFPQLLLFAQAFGIDGFEFNDIGGGYRSFPPYTRYLRQHGSDEPLYPDSMFGYYDGVGDWQWYSQDRVNEILWREGGQNFADLIVTINDRLRESRRVVADFGGEGNDNTYPWVMRYVIARNNGHAMIRYHGTDPGPAPPATNHRRYTSLSANVREEFIPDAYTGAMPFTVSNLLAFVNDVNSRLEGTHPNFPFLRMWEPYRAAGAAMEFQGLQGFAPFIVDLTLTGRMSAAEAQALAVRFRGTSTIPNRFGTLYFSNLPTLEEDPGIAAFLTAFTGQVFGLTTVVNVGGGNRPRSVAP